MTTPPDAAMKRWTDPEWWRTRKAAAEAVVERTNQENQAAFEATVPTEEEPIVWPPNKVGICPFFSISWTECDAIAAELAALHRRAEAGEQLFRDAGSVSWHGRAEALERYRTATEPNP